MALLRAPTLRPGMLVLSPHAAFQASTSLVLPPAIATSSRSVAAFHPVSSRCYASFDAPSPLTAEREAEYEDERRATLLQRPSQSNRDVLLSGLPPSATPTDIRGLVPDSKTRNDLSRIEFIYTKSLRPSSQALVSFSHYSHARHFEAAAHGSILGGRMLSARTRSVKDRESFLRSTYGSWPSEYQLLFDLIEYESGKLVLLRNIPQDTFEARLEERLASRYDLRPQDRWRGKRVSYAGYNIDSKGYGGSHDVVLGGVVKLPKTHMDATTTSFIVRCQTMSEAHRLMRRWHNTYFAPATFDIQDTGARYRVTASILF